MDSYFAPAERTDQQVFANQVEIVSQSPIMSALLKATGGMLIVLNEDRQIVGLNVAFLTALGIGDPASVLGLRLGETISCIHAADVPHGCGTTPFCATCGAAIATMSAINDDTVSEKNCALTAEKDGQTLERYLTIRAQPLVVDNSRWILVFAQDITHQHSLSTLEHVFFHDINNILTALIGNSTLLAREMPDQRRAHLIVCTAQRLCAEVALQRFLSNQKDEENLLTLHMVTIGDIHEELATMLHDHPAAHHKTVDQAWPDRGLTVCTDLYLLSRVVGNMLLNALEATAEGGTVRLTAVVGDTEIVWNVWNEAYIPSDVQLRIFQKHFSTKAAMGRGMGTHSMKLLGEKYLNGQVVFSSSPESGTTFCFTHPLAC